MREVSMTRAADSEAGTNLLISPEVRRSLALLSPRERRTYWAAMGLQMATSLLDLAGVLLFGMSVVIAASAAQGVAIPTLDPSRAVLVLRGADVPATTASLVLAGIAALLLILKTNRLPVDPALGHKVPHRVVNARLRTDVRGFLTNFRSCTSTASQANGQPSPWCTALPGRSSSTLTNFMVLWVELSLLVVLGGALLLINPLIALFAIGYFGLIAIVMNQVLKGWAYSTGKVMAETAWESNLTVQDGIAMYREITVADRRQHYVDRFRSVRQAGSEAYADQQFIGQLPRYGMEIALIVGAGLLVIALLQLGTVESALGSLVLFLTAATRVMPSLLRLNGSRITLRSLAARADYAFTMASHLREHTTLATLQGIPRCSGRT